jgi:hypothetical protein
MHLEARKRMPEEMAEIMTGKGDYFPGLIPLILAYLDPYQLMIRSQ